MDTIVTQHGEQNVGAALDEFLAPTLCALVSRAATLADARAMPIYVVGGTVRDLLLGRLPGDLDLVVEGDAIALAEAMAVALGGTVTAHAAFGTAVLELPDSTTLDVITARSETYDAPAALPRVQPSDLRDDLFRRDFTINTLAVQLNPSRYGRLFDLHSGLDDLRRGVVRVLHDASFVDDPTRILRAVRMAARLGFVIESHTRTLIVAALAQGMIERTTPQRIVNELRLLLHEPQPEHAISLLDDLGALLHLAPTLCWSDTQAAQFHAARQATFPHVKLSHVYLALLLYPLRNDERAAIIARYRPNTAIAQLISDISVLRQRVPLLRHEALPHSAVDIALTGVGEAALRAVQLAEAAPVPAYVELYLSRLRSTQIALNGHDLLRLGLKPGPRFRELLAGLRAARLDGLVQTPADEEAWVQQRLAKS